MQHQQTTRLRTASVEIPGHDDIMNTCAFTNRTSLLLTCLLAATSLISHAADVVYVGTTAGSSNAEQRIKTAAEFYGLKENAIIFTNPVQISAVVNAIRDPKTIAVVLGADTLSSLNRPQIIAA